MMYTFMAKFEELNKNIRPLQGIAAQMYPSNFNQSSLGCQFSVYVHAFVTAKK